MQFELLHPADQLVLLMDRIYRYGMTTTSGGNLSILDSNGDIWITPGGIDKGSLTRKDIIQVKPDGKVVGIHNPSSELPFHQQVYRARPDIHAVLHAHPPALVAFSIARKLPNISLIPNAALMCGKVEMAKYDLPGSVKLGEKIAKVFEGGANTVMLENHGTVIGSDTLFNAFMAFETLDFCARLEINALQIGKPRSISKKHMKVYEEKQVVTLNEFVPCDFPSDERALRYELCHLIKRAYDQQLFTSAQGTYSARLSGDDFVITPFGVDRDYLEPTDIVRIHNGMCEAGKTPSRSVLLHDYIYRKHPEINSIILAAPPAIMAFAVTSVPFDSRLIPESYIMLRDVKKIPFGASFLQPEMTADIFSASTPIIIAENDCAIVTGSSPLNAFDRLEVLDYSAKALLGVQKVGPVVSITDEEVDEIEVAFHLK